MAAFKFSMSFVTLEKPERPPIAPLVLRQLLADHRPWEMLENMALVIIDQTYAALLEILGLAPPVAADGGGARVFEANCPVDPAAPGSPVLHVSASARYCCVRLIDGFHGGAAAPAEAEECRPPQQYRLPRAVVGVSARTLHLTRVGGGDRTDYWACAEVRPDVAGKKGLLEVVETVRSRLDGAIRLEARLAEMARASGHRSPKVDEIVAVRAALEEIRAQVDLDAFMRRRSQKRRHARRPAAETIDVDDHEDDAEVLTKRLRALHV
ncbi:hypothetical protein ACP70R_022481 [Stipagrostis hirtigluma subsp. patula]